MKPSSKNDYDFRMFSSLKPFFETTYYGKVLIPVPKNEQNASDEKLEDLKNYSPKISNNIETKDNILKNAQNLYDGREMIINTFENKLFPLASGNYYKEFEESTESEEEGEEIKESKDDEPPI